MFFGSDESTGLNCLPASVHARPILATANEPPEHAAFDTQPFRINQRDMGRVGLPILCIVDPALPTIDSRGLHVEEHRHADNRAITELSFGILAIRLISILRARNDTAQIIRTFLDANTGLAVFDQPFTDWAHRWVFVG